MYLTRTILFLITLAAAPASLAGDLLLRSGPTRTSLIELYTSEGCSSCPPSERHLNTYLSHPDLWTRYVPLAFHVDYWDYIGWKDRFARPEHGQRQRAYARLLRARTVYTPAFFVNGKSWRHGFFDDKAPQDKHEKTGILSIRLNGKRVEGDYQTPNPSDAKLHLNLALLGLGLKSDIERGENAGDKAAHEFVVVGFAREPSTQGRWQTRLPELYAGVDAREISGYALAAWISEAGNPTPLQAVGGFIER